MKVAVALFLFGAVIAVVQGDSLQDEFKKVHDACNANEVTRIDKETMEKLQKGEGDMANSQLGAHLLCMHEKFGAINENGDVVVEKFKEFLVKSVDNEENVEKIIKDCLTKPKGASTGAFCIYMVTCSRKYDTFSKLMLN